MGAFMDESDTTPHQIPSYAPYLRRLELEAEDANAASAPFRAEHRKRERAELISKAKSVFIDGLYYGVLVGLLAGFTFWMAA